MGEYHECESRGACDDVREELVLAHAKIERLRAALKPFADALTDLERVHTEPGMLLACCRAELTLYEFSQARFAYEQK